MRKEILSLPALTGLVIGSMVGAGIFSLPRIFGVATGPAGAMIAWLIAGSGMFALAYVFHILADQRPDLDSGIYAYAREGFGNYAGFLSAFGYWLVGCIANVSYWVLIKSTLGFYFPVFGNGNTLVAVAVSSVLLWLFHILVLQDIRQAASINTIVTCAKIIPIAIFILILTAFFDRTMFMDNLLGNDARTDDSLFSQINATMMVTVFVFIGIEGASVYSRFARKRSHIGIATLVGFAVVLGLMVLVTLLPYAIMPRHEIAALRQPSMAGVLATITGNWGLLFISCGLILSVLGAYLAWSLIVIEVPYNAARDGAMPGFLGLTNRNGVPATALWMTNIIIQLFLISILWSGDAFKLLIELSTTMALVPYLLVALYGLKLAWAARRANQAKQKTLAFLAASIIATIYALFLLYAAGMELLLFSLTLYAPGSLLYVWARREQGKTLFSALEWAMCAAVLAGGIYAAFALLSGKYSL